MNLYRLDNPATRQILQTLASGGSILWSAVEKEALGTEPRLNENELENLNRAMVSVIGSTGGRESERILLRDVRETIQIGARAAGDSGFWRWLSVKFFFEAVQERHASGAALANEANFGVGGKFEGLIARIWFRAEVAYDKSALDPYWLSKRGDQDFWRSHILRLRYSNARSFVRELIKYQYPTEDGAPRLHASNSRGIRTFVKRIQALHASSALEMADRDLVFPMLEHLSAGLAPGGGAQA